ncbi:DUF917 domain-containing protein [Sphingomonas colocasiae]|uniref:DUF917 domain-containing protein n=1 Tax=Sphingomonas colocasiae TaxID=1848973 RepID=A0ABS7PQI7_9SPHN|nr:DUF917 domain-containing protein [Sphingomonas colocasiae]MBY8823456.1 DUF917 domain-containing protein [Sphingomonas colocasiae]
MSWLLSQADIAPIARGCTMLGSGGGGDTYCAVILLSALLAEGHRIPIIDADTLDDDGFTVNVGYMGAPVVLSEKLFEGSEMVAAIDAMRGRLKGPLRALISAEIGGMNGMVPLIASALTGLPVVDGDGMGRAFPRADHVTFAFNGVSCLPTVLTSEAGDVVTIERASNARAEDIGRAVATLMGSMAFAVDYPLKANEVRAYAVPGTLSLARSIGRAIGEPAGAQARLDALTCTLRQERDITVAQIFAGRVSECERATREGFDRGHVEIRVAGGSRSLRIDFQNEFLMAFEGGSLVASTPDIIAVVDADTLAPLTSDAIRYGQNVRVLVIEAPAQLRTPVALDRVGPRAFGYPCDYLPIGAGR